MKSLASFDQAVGADGGKAGGSVGVEGDQLKIELHATYPLAKVVEPATAALDSLLNKVKAAIPGSWDDALIDQFKAEYKDDLVKLLSEAPAQEPAEVAKV